MDFEGQHPNENVLHFHHRHPVVMRKSLVAMLLILVIGLVPFAFVPWQQWTWYLAGGGLILSIIVFLYGYISWYFTYIIVTDMRILQVKQQGLFNRELVGIDLEKIQSINLEVKGIQQTLLKFGTIVIQTIAGDLIIHNMHHPQKVHEQMTHAVRVTKQDLEG